MGRRRIAQLLGQLKDNQARDIENAAAIYTVAQGAVNALDDSQTVPTLPVRRITKAELVQRYGSFNGCRRAAKEQGITFRKTPSWHQLEAAFAYRDACHQMVRDCLTNYPEELLQGVSLTISLQD
ncbi:hypothetical protein XM38_001190 [Halomicronema hongdechloris C2206]|uniref:Uncharacterized protein n=1 Tax=Halomicronema hongdechloris C2206 TaxID=1641165 RepID=A0A1Z3HFX1_9CYAN|nr:hypothetical protein [Halomicronema hongdechloris]ASC69193.1 hypothetical protein XM38_001190 [Halomicronema hongdechloris C2206]